MNTLRMCIVASALLGVSLAARPPSEVRAETIAVGDRVVTGELVITNSAKNQFRLVEHSGSFTAPAGTSVEAFDGKPVQVEIGRDGRVQQITQMPIRFAPIEHGIEMVSGELIARDAGTFSIAGDSRVYVVPPGVDARGYAGHMVELRLDDQGRVMEISRSARAGRTMGVSVPRNCMVGDANVISGSSICRSGTTFRCRDGEWVNIGDACS